MVREITGIGEGKGPFIVFHDGFVGQAQTIAEGGWLDFLPGADRVALDSHPYLCFGDPSADPLGFQATKVCFRRSFVEPRAEPTSLAAVYLLGEPVEQHSGRLRSLRGSRMESGQFVLFLVRCRDRS